MKKYIKFLWSLLQHKWYVFLAGLKLRLPIWQLIIHDWQKFHPKEFGAYARYFQGDKRDIWCKADFMFAWHHHLRNGGKHHWEYWIVHPGYDFSIADNSAIPIPEKYIKEMVADWMGASKAYTGSWDMTDWLNNNYERITSNMHVYSSFRLYFILKDSNLAFGGDN